MDRDFKQEYFERGEIFYDKLLHNIIVNSQWIEDIVREIDRLREENKKLEEQNENIRIADHDYWWTKEQKIERLRAENETWKKRWVEITTDIVICSDDEYEGQSQGWIDEIVEKYPLSVEKDRERD